LYFYFKKYCLDRVPNINEQMLFYVQIFAEQEKIKKNYEKSMQNIKKTTQKDKNVIQEDLLDAKRRIIGKIMMDYKQIGLIDKETNMVKYEQFIQNPNIKKLVDGELKFMKKPIDHETFMKELVNSLDMMKFFKRKSELPGAVFEVEDRTDELKLFIAKEFSKAKSILTKIGLFNRF